MQKLGMRCFLTLCEAALQFDDSHLLATGDRVLGFSSPKLNYNN